MSIHLLDHVWTTSRHKGWNLLLLLTLADYTADDGLAFPSIATLARNTCLKERNVPYLVKSLSTLDDLEAPELELPVTQKAEAQRCNLYVRVLPIMPECACWTSGSTRTDTRLWMSSNTPLAPAHHNHSAISSYLHRNSLDIIKLTV